MNNFDLYRLLNFIVSKNKYAQSIREPEFEAELQAKNLRHFRKRLGLPENYVPGTVGVNANRITDRDLLPFFVEGEYTVSATNGDVLLPGWYYIEDYYSSSSRSSEIISHQECSARLRNALTAPTTKDLVAYMIKKGLRVFPFGTGGVAKVNVMYYRQPQSPVFRVITNPTTLEMEYNFSESQELEWDDGSKLDILTMILADYGLNIQRQDVTQYANKLIETGK